MSKKRNSNKRNRNSLSDSEDEHTIDNEESVDEFVDLLLGHFHDDVEEKNEPKLKRPRKLKYVELKVKVDTLDDIINISKNNKAKNGEKYNIDLEAINRLEPILEKFKSMIGMKKLKQTITDQIIYFLQDFEKKNSHMMHTVIAGPPGCGKTEVANIMANIYSALGFLKNNKVKKVRRSDLIGEYLGQTAVKTQKAIDNAKGGVLLIDEAYSLGNPEGKDIFSKECLDTINQNLSEEKTNFICIIVGYKEQLQSCFFNYNPGLERRFPFRFEVDEYNHNDLFNIFKKQVNDADWSIVENEQKLLSFFEKNRKVFKYNGGDLETLFQVAKISHSKRVFGLSKDERKKLNANDIENGFEAFMLNNNVKERLEKDDIDIISHLYN